MGRTFVIDGANFDSLSGFYDALEREALVDATWGRNLDALDDALSGGVGAIGPGDTIEWKNASLSSERLGYRETAHHLKQQLAFAHPSQHDSLRLAIALAEQGTGQTAFDWILEIFREHPDVSLVLA
jgi:RNAse (barnase) inhibitor barstar